MAGAGDHVAGMEAGKGLARGVKRLMKGYGACDRCCDVGHGIPNGGGRWLGVGPWRVG